MQKEIERKFLVEEIPEEIIGISTIASVEQFYLSLEPEVRIREESFAGVKAYTFTLKRGSGISREECNIKLSLSSKEYANLKQMAIGIIKKYRYTVQYRAFKTTIDVFLDNLEGIMLCEVEFPSLEYAEQYKPEPWMGKEVTGDKRYANQSLAALQGLDDLKVVL